MVSPTRAHFGLHHVLHRRRHLVAERYVQLFNHFFIALHDVLLAKAKGRLTERQIQRDTSQGSVTQSAGRCGLGIQAAAEWHYLDASRLSAIASNFATLFQFRAVAGTLSVRSSRGGSFERPMPSGK